MAEALREYWATVSHSPDVGRVKPPRDQQAWNRLLSKVTPVLTEAEVTSLGGPISPVELAPKRNEDGVIIDAGILRSLPRGKSGGVDGWSYEFIQLAGDRAADGARMECSLYWETTYAIRGPSGFASPPA